MTTIKLFLKNFLFTFLTLVVVAIVVGVFSYVLNFMLIHFGFMIAMAVVGLMVVVILAAIFTYEDKHYF